MRWHQDEDSILQDLMGRFPIKELIARYRMRSGRQKLPKRSDNAIYRRIIALGGSARCFVENYHLDELSRLAQIDRRRLWYWIRTGKLKGRRSGEKWWVAQDDLRTFAHSNPVLFRHLPKSTLVYIVGPAIATIIESAQLVKPYGKMPVRQKSTGTIYPSISVAGRATGIHRNTIAKQIKDGGDWEAI